MMDLFIALIIKTWIFASGVSLPALPLMESPGAWVQVLASDENCLMYRAASKTTPQAALAIYPRRSSSSCIESISSHPTSLLTIDNAPKFKLHENRLEMILVHNGEERNFFVPLWGKQDSLKRAAYISDRPSENVKFLNLGEECLGLDCARCPRGFMHVTSATGVKRICHDPSQCGDRNQPACYLGQDWAPKKSGCIDDSKAGWCRAGLAIRCSKETELLVCE